MSCLLGLFKRVWHGATVTRACGVAALQSRPRHVATSESRTALAASYREHRNTDAAGANERRRRSRAFFLGGMGAEKPAAVREIAGVALSRSHGRVTR
jgi:hypothetical protein